MKSILLIEDSLPMAKIITGELDSAGFRVLHAATGLDGLNRFHSSQPDLVILDWMLPDIDGLEVLRRLRERSAAPVLMLTARGDEIDRVIGLEVGADDYLVKPFGLRELIARVRALLRRDERLKATLAADKPGPGRPAPGVLRCLDLELDPEAYQATLSGVGLELSHTEFELLHLLLRNPRRTFTRKYLLETIWDETFLEGDRSVDNTVMRLRKKLGALGEWIETVRSVGYRWRE